MRLNLRLQVQKPYQVLPLNYQYPVSSWIYSRMYSGNSEFADWLHQSGYRLENKRFKLFTFSNFHVPRRQVAGDRLTILSTHISLQLSFLMDPAVENFVIGLFLNQEMEIEDRHSKARLYVETVESLPQPVFTASMKFKCLSPLCLSKTVDLNDHKQTRYLSPEAPDYRTYFFKNLMYKYMSLSQYVPGLLAPSVGDTERELGLELLNRPRSRLVTVKAGSPQQSRVRGYFYRFRLIAPPELLRFGYEAGYGEKNSLGFGCTEVMQCSGILLVM